MFILIGICLCVSRVISVTPVRENRFSGSPRMLRLLSNGWRGVNSYFFALFLLVFQVSRTASGVRRPKQGKSEYEGWAGCRLPCPSMALAYLVQVKKQRGHISGFWIWRIALFVAAANSRSSPRRCPNPAGWIQPPAAQVATITPRAGCCIPFLFIRTEFWLSYRQCQRCDLKN